MAKKVEEHVDFEMNDMVGHLIRVSQQVQVAIWNANIGIDGLTSPQFAVLHVLAHEEPLDQRTLGERASLDRSTVADIVARLDRRRLLARRRDTVDGRRNLVVLTDAGRAVHKVAVKAAFKINELLLASLSEEDGVALARILNQILRDHRDDITADLRVPGWSLDRAAVSIKSRP